MNAEKSEYLKWITLVIIDCTNIKKCFYEFKYNNEYQIKEKRKTMKLFSIRMLNYKTFHELIIYTKTAFTLE